MKSLKSLLVLFMSATLLFMFASLSSAQTASSLECNTPGDCVFEAERSEAALYAPITGSADVLYFADHYVGENYVLPALDELGLTYDVASSWSEFNQLLGPAYPAAIALNQNWSLGADYDSFSSYLNQGGRLLFTDWRRTQSFAELFGGEYTAQRNTTPVEIIDAFLKEGVSNPLDIFNPGWGTWAMGMRLQAEDGKVLTKFPNGDSALIQANEGRSLLLGFLADTLPAEDGQKFFENLINLLFEVVEVEYDIALKAIPSEAGQVEGAGSYAQGEIAEICATANEGWKFIEWRDEDGAVSAESCFTIEVTEDLDLEAYFTEEIVDLELFSVTLSADPLEGGRVRGAGTFEEGTEVKVCAEANLEWNFVQWLDDLGRTVSHDECYVFDIAMDRNLTAVFEQKPYQVFLSASPADGGDVGGAGRFDPGDEVTVWAEPFDGWSFEYWTEDGRIVEEKIDYTFTITRTRNLVANFKEIIDPRGKLSVIIQPQEAVDAGAKWRLKGTDAWYDSGEVKELEAGQYLIEFRVIMGTGFTPPGDIPVTIHAGRTASILGEYAGGPGEADEVIVATFGNQTYRYDMSAKQWQMWLPFGSSTVAAGDIDDDGIDDFIAVFGNGIWAYLSSIEDWKHVSQFRPATIAAGDMSGNGRDDVIAGWPGFGMYYLSDIDTENWTQFLRQFSPDAMEIGDIYGAGTQAVVASWREHGVFIYDEYDSWHQITTARFPVFTLGNVAGEDKSELIGSWPGYGIYYLDDIATGQFDMISDQEASILTAGDLTGDGRDEVVALIGDRIRVYYVERDEWETISDRTMGRPSNIITMKLKSSSPFLP